MHSQFPGVFAEKSTVSMDRAEFHKKSKALKLKDSILSFKAFENLVCCI